MFWSASWRRLKQLHDADIWDLEIETFSHDSMGWEFDDVLVDTQFLPDEKEA